MYNNRKINIVAKYYKMLGINNLSNKFIKTLLKKI